MGKRPTPAVCGTRSAYAQGCRCEPCRAAHRLYAAQWRRKRLDAGWKLSHGRFTPPEAD